MKRRSRHLQRAELSYYSTSYVLLESYVGWELEYACTGYYDTYYSRGLLLAPGARLQTSPSACFFCCLVASWELALSRV